MKKMYDLDLDLEHATKLSETTTELHKLYYDSKYSHFNLEQGIEHIKKNIITEYNNKINPLKKQIDSTQNQIDSNTLESNATNKRLKETEKELNNLKKSIADKESEIQSYFPEKLHDIALYDDIEYKLGRLTHATGALKRLFGFDAKKQKIRVIHHELTKLYDSQKKLKQNKVNYTKESTVHNSTQTELNEKLSDLESQAQEIYDNAYTQLHNEVASWIYTNNPENISKTKNMNTHGLGLQLIDEPVCFMLDLEASKSADRIDNILKHIGLEVGDTPDAYTISTTNSKGARIITPFFSPKTVRRDIMALKKYLSFHGIKIVGAHPPLRHYQLNPNILIKNKKTYSREERETMGYKVLYKINKMNGITPLDFYHKYTNKNFLFRGQTFMTADPRAAYGAVTPRHGAGGIAFATTDASYAVTYCGATNPYDNGGVAGKTMKADHLPRINGIKLGFVTVFERSPRNIMVGNTNLESITGVDYIKEKKDKDKNNPETLLNPSDNKIVKRYITYDGKMYEIDEKDPEWHEILDFYAPELYKTYKDDYLTCNRIENLQKDYHNAGNQTKTYDLTPEQLAQMGYQAPAQKMTNATKSLKSKIAHSNQQILTATNTDDRAA